MLSQLHEVLLQLFRNRPLLAPELDFAKRYIALGRAEGRAAVITKQLALRFGALTPQIETRVGEASIQELDAIAERLLTAQSLQEALGSP